MFDQHDVIFSGKFVFIQHKKENLVRHCCFHNADINVRIILRLP